MSSVMSGEISGEPASVQTRPSLLDRLKSGEDSEGWHEFYRVYGKLVRDFAIRAGLTGTEADDVVQETAVGVARNLPGFQYDPTKCRFKTWLLNLSSWRIKDQIKKRRAGERFVGPAPAGGKPTSSDQDSRRTATVERVPDPAGDTLDVMFEAEWQESLLSVALDRIKSKFTLKQFQAFDLHARNGWPAADVARSLGLSIANVYVTKHRIAAALKKETAKLEKELEQG
jgi:RNA polymerase sigma factor (sigma-70 family)